jgi:glycosyltransferase involved in cell wall biosynthesis
VTALPTVSIVIVAHNEADKLERCLGSLVAQRFPSFEIVVVDAESTDNSVTIARKYTSKVFRVDRNVLGYSRQRGLDLSSGDIVGVIDPDAVFLSNELIARVVDAFVRGENMGIIWPMNIGPMNSRTARVFFLFWEEYARRRIMSHPNVALGANAFYLRSAISEAGGFSEQLGYASDTELTIRILQKGYSCALVEEPMVHYTNLSLREFTQNQLWGARYFAWYGAGRLGMTHMSAIYEILILGTRSMIKIIGEKKDLGGFALPVMLTIRAAAYMLFYLKAAFDKRLANMSIQ